MFEDAPPSSTADPLEALRTRVTPGVFERVRDRVDRIPRDARPWALAVAVVSCGAIAVALAAVMGVWTPASPPASITGGDPATADLPFAGTSTDRASATTAAAQVVVHAAGAVAVPGLYHLPAGSRVGDLLAAAGGPGPDADADRVNLAAPLADGARLYVPRVGELDVPSVAAGDSGGGADPTTTESDSAPVDLNTATAEQLEALPGVGPSIATAILDHRKRNGRFRSVDDLLEVRGIGPARLEQLRTLVRV